MSSHWRGCWYLEYFDRDRVPVSSNKFPRTGCRVDEGVVKKSTEENPRRANVAAERGRCVRNQKTKDKGMTMEDSLSWEGVEEIGVSTLGLKCCVSLAKGVSRQWFNLQGSCSEPRMAHGLWNSAGDIVCRVGSSVGGSMYQ